MIRPKMVSALTDFMVERQWVYLRKERGNPKPWTKNKILQQYRFCNIYREQDTVTKWIADNWRTPNTKDPDLWFAMFVARYVNLPSTLEALGYPVPWSHKKWLNVTNNRIALKQQVFNAAYIIPPTAGTESGGTTVGGPKHESIGRFFNMLWDKREYMRPTKLAGLDRSLGNYCERLTALPGVGTFMAGQVIADLKYSAAFKNSIDWWEFAVSGPGSRRGLNRICERDVNQSWKEFTWFETLNKLRDQVNSEIQGAPGMTKLCGQDMQNSLCEFDKYCRVYYKEGKQPKQKYNGRS